MARNRAVGAGAFGHRRGRASRLVHVETRAAGAETLAIEATVVDERVLKGIAPDPNPAPPTGPGARARAGARTRAGGRAGPAQRRPGGDRERQEEERLAPRSRRNSSRSRRPRRSSKEREEPSASEAEKQAAAKAAAEKAAAEKAAADKKAAEKKRAEDAAAAKKAAEEKARLARAGGTTAQSGGRRAGQCRAQQRRGRALACADHRADRSGPGSGRPRHAPGITCTVLVKQVPGGEVTDVQVESCTVDDAALRQSVEAAVYRASPLPPPPAGVPFERNLKLTFAPQ